MKEQEAIKEQEISKKYGLPILLGFLKIKKN